MRSLGKQKKSLSAKPTVHKKHTFNQTVLTIFSVNHLERYLKFQHILHLKGSPSTPQLYFLVILSLAFPYTLLDLPYEPQYKHPPIRNMYFLQSSIGTYFRADAPHGIIYFHLGALAYFSSYSHCRNVLVEKGSFC